MLNRSDGAQVPMGYTPCSTGLTYPVASAPSGNKSCEISVAEVSCACEQADLALNHEWLAWPKLASTSGGPRQASPCTRAKTASLACVGRREALSACIQTAA